MSDNKMEHSVLKKIKKINDNIKFLKNNENEYKVVLTSVKFHLEVEGIGTKDFAFLDEGEYGKIKFEEKEYTLTESDREKINNSVDEFEKKSYPESKLWDDIKVDELVTHTCVMNGGKDAHNELVMWSVFKGYLIEKEEKSDREIVIKKGKQVEFMVKKKESNSEAWYITYDDEKQSIDISSEDKSRIDKAVDNILAGLQKLCPNMDSSVLGGLEDNGNSRYRLIAYPDYKKHKRKLDNQENKPIFQIGKYNSDDDIHYYVTTGLYSGVINFANGNKLKIASGYSEELFKRMLQRCCGVYADKKTSKETSESDSSIYSLIAQYLYLISLRKAMDKIIPRKYVYLKDRGYSIKGNIDINEYIKKDLVSFDKKISHVYPERVEIKNILVVLYAALKSCKISDRGSILPKLATYNAFFREICSGKRPTPQLIRNIHNEKCLKNSLYADFKNTLELARIILQEEDSAPGSDSKSLGISGYLIDVSFLWEMYLYHVMNDKLDGWEVEDQKDIYMYENKFYKKTNHPDFVLTNKENGDIYILDAKFKRMIFKEQDVDNHDLQQVHSYSYYYHLKFPDKFKGTALIFPSKEEYKDADKGYNCKENESNMFGLDDDKAKEKFNILALRDNPSDLNESERLFIKELTDFLQNHKE